MSNPVYADYNASAPICREASAAVVRALDLLGNPSSVHGFGRSARRLIEDARQAAARVVGASPADVVFTAGGTEANAMALWGGEYRTVLASAIEHPSVLSARPDLTLLPVDQHGVVSLEALETALARSEGPVLVSLMLANNETGVIQPVARAAEIARAAGARIHCDAVQALGRVPVDIASLGVDCLTVSAHKVGGPAGAGALVSCAGGSLTPLVRGGGQERGRRGGTENLIGIAGFGAAVEVLPRSLADQERQRALRDHLEAAILAAAPEAAVFGRGADRLANTTCIEMPGVRSELQVMAFDLAGVAVSAGAACSSGKVSASGVLAAMGVAPERSECAIRISIGTATTTQDIEKVISVWMDIFNRRRREAA